MFLFISTNISANNFQEPVVLREVDLRDVPAA